MSFVKADTATIRAKPQHASLDVSATGDMTVNIIEAARVVPASRTDSDESATKARERASIKFKATER